jgi:hypothetical protein
MDVYRPNAGWKGDHIMKKLIAVLAILLVAGTAGVAGAGTDVPVASGRALKIFLARQSNVPSVDIMKNLSEKCPNVTITATPQKSDYMLKAFWSPDDRYRFEVVAKGGDSIYATKTVLLSNAVKDVCHFLNTHS